MHAEAPAWTAMLTDWGNLGEPVSKELRPDKSAFGTTDALYSRYKWTTPKQRKHPQMLTFFLWVRTKKPATWEVGRQVLPGS